MRMLAQKFSPKSLVGLAIPNLAKGLLENVPHDQAVIITGSKGGNTAGQAIPIHRDIRSGPGTRAVLPG